MNFAPASAKSRAAAYSGVAARWILGALFLYLGLKKAMAPVEFLKLTRQYEMVHSPFLLNSIAAGLPWFEAVCGMLLLTGIAVRGTALTLVVELVPFTALILKRALALQTLRAISFCAVKFDCGCGAGEVFVCHKLAENLLLIAMAGWLLSGAGSRWCAQYSLFSKSPPAV